MEKKCEICGNILSENMDTCPYCQKRGQQNFRNKLVIAIVLVVIIIAIGVAISIASIRNKEKQQQEYYDSLPIKVDISMTSYYGTIEYILYELGLDFDLVTMGANCYTGVQRNEFDTEKFGKLYTEFRYCKSNETMIFRVYNKDSDQPLRQPKTGELSEFDKFGIRQTNKSNNL